MVGNYILLIKMYKQLNLLFLMTCSIVTASICPKAAYYLDKGDDISIEVSTDESNTSPFVCSWEINNANENNFEISIDRVDVNSFDRIDE